MEAILYIAAASPTLPPPPPPCPTVTTQMSPDTAKCPLVGDKIAQLENHCFNPILKGEESFSCILSKAMETGLKKERMLHISL